MERVTQFAFRVSNEERKVIAELAKKLRRSQSDTVRFVLLEAARQILQSDKTPVSLNIENKTINFD